MSAQALRAGASGVQVGPPPTPVVPVTPHAPTHLPATGTDPLATGPASTLAIGDVAATGVGDAFSRLDHVHAFPAPAAPANVDKSAAVAGASTNAARADHKHDVTTAAPATGIGGANAEGVAVSLSRSDHDHLLRETGGPTNLAIGAIADTQVVTRSGGSLVGVAQNALAVKLPTGYVNALAFAYVSATQVQIGAGSCRDSTDAADILAGGTLTADITVAGANGLDAGVEAANTWYAVHVIDGPAVATASLLSTSAAAPVLPAGYTVFRRIGWVRNDGSSNFRPFSCLGLARSRRYEYNASTRAALSAVTSSIQNTFTTLSLAAFIPSTALRGGLELACASLASDNYAEVQTNGSALASATAPQRVQAPDAGSWSGHVRVTTDATQQIQYRTSSASTEVTIIVYEWEEDV